VGDGGGVQTATINGSLDWNSPAGGSVNPLTGSVYSSDNANIVVTGIPSDAAPAGNADELGDDADFQFSVTATFDPTALADVYDAADLPKIENAATAVANNQSIKSDVPIMLHDAQFNFGGFNDYSDASEGEVIQGVIGLLAAGFAFEEYADSNLHTAELLAFSAAAAGGIITPGKVEAKAKVSDILNAYVDNSATAVGNNLSASIESETAANHIIVADITQFNYADVKAKAKVEDVSINNYEGFGAAGLGGGGADITPIVSNVATAVGNNLSIKVGVPE
jgi:hypothetical protein